MTTPAEIDAQLERVIGAAERKIQTRRRHFWLMGEAARLHAEKKTQEATHTPTGDTDGRGVD